MTGVQTCALPICPVAFVIDPISTIAPKPPVVTWTEGKEYDFGEVRFSSVTGVAFHYKNTSPDSIRLETVRTTCGCTAADWSDKSLAPGATGELKIEYAADQSGPFRKKIRVFFDRQRKPEILWVYGEVK